MICQSCRDNEHGDCRGGTWCDCQHRTDRQPAVLLGVASPPCTCDEQEAWSGGGRGVFAIPPPAGCPVHGGEIRRLRAVEP